MWDNMIKLKDLIKEINNLAVIPSKYKPANIDPSINPTSHIQTSLMILGIDPKTIYRKYNKNSSKKIFKGSFWNHNPEFLWRLLELAKSRYKWEMKSCHTDKGLTNDHGRSAQLNAAWNFIKDLFSRRGFDLAENIQESLTEEDYIQSHGPFTPDEIDFMIRTVALNTDIGQPVPDKDTVLYLSTNYIVPMIEDSIENLNRFPAYKKSMMILQSILNKLTT